MRRATLFLLMSLTACATPAPVGEKTASKKNTKPTPFVLGAGIVRPESLDLNTQAAMATAPVGTLLVSQVIRPLAEVREGPGVNFSLTDRILEVGEQVIVFEEHGVWSKIISVKKWESGWVHVRALSKPALNRKRMVINFARFPTVLAMKPLNYVRSFVGGDSVKLEEIIPRGKQFRALQVTENKTLIWMSENNSIVWIKGRDMQ